MTPEEEAYIMTASTVAPEEVRKAIAAGLTGFIEALRPMSRPPAVAGRG